MSHDQQAQRLREIDDLLAECQRHDMTGVRVSYAQLRALRDAIADLVPPAAVAVPAPVHIKDERIKKEVAFFREQIAKQWKPSPYGEAIPAPWLFLSKACDYIEQLPAAPVAQKFVAAVVKDVREDDGGWIQEIATEGVKLDYGTLLYVAAPVAQKVTNAPPAEFVEYMAKNYPPNTIIVDAAWHARPIWNAACHALQNCGLLAARNQPEKK